MIKAEEFRLQSHVSRVEFQWTIHVFWLKHVPTSPCVLCKLVHVFSPHPPPPPSSHSHIAMEFLLTASVEMPD